MLVQPILANAAVSMRDCYKIKLRNVGEKSRLSGDIHRIRCCYYFGHGLIPMCSNHSRRLTTALFM